jgi:hypothetical protein
VTIVGQGVAKWAGIQPADLGRATLALYLKRTHPVIFALARPPLTLTVVGIYARCYVFGDMQIFMPLDAFRAAYGVPDGISWLYVRAATAEHLPAVEREVRARLGEVADIISPSTVTEFQSTATAAVLRLALGGIALAAALVVVVVFFVMLLALPRLGRRHPNPARSARFCGGGDPAEATVPTSARGVAGPPQQPKHQRRHQ